MLRTCLFRALNLVLSASRCEILTKIEHRVPSHGDLAIDYLLFTIDYCFPSWLSVPFVAVLGTPYGEQRTPYHGDFFRIHPLVCITVRIMYNRFM